MGGQAAGGIAVEDRFDHLLDEGLDHMGDFLGRAAHQRGESEGHVVFHGQLASAVLAHQFLLAGDKAVAIGPAELDHFPGPQTGAVAADQGFVQVEDCQCHQATSRIALASMLSAIR